MTLGRCLNLVGMVSVAAILGCGGGGGGGGTNPTTPSKIAFDSDRDGNLEIYMMDADGANPTNLTMNSAQDYEPSLNPAGSIIVFSTNRNGNLEIFTMNSNGSNQQRITNATVPIGGPWADDEPSIATNGKIAFTSTRVRIDPSHKRNKAIYITDTTASAPVLLISDSSFDGFDQTQPAISPDGTKVLFVSSKDSGNGNGDIYVCDISGGNVQRLTADAADDSEPKWSSDGTKIVFTTTRAGSRDIWTMNSDGTNQQSLVSNPAGDFEGCFSNDGTLVVFVSNRGQTNGSGDIYSVPVTGGTQTQLTNNTNDDRHPSMH